MLKMIIGVIAYLVLAPFVGGFLSGVDRKLSARMQGRVGPSVFQPFYDVLKLFEKDPITVNHVQSFYVTSFFIFILVTGAMIFGGQDLLMALFTLTLASTFLVVAAFSSNSPFAQLGAERELLQAMAYEPMVLLTAVGFYLTCGSFNVADIMASTEMPFVHLWGIFFGFLFILTIKMRKAPFDLSMSHHAHQELVGGLKTEFSGSTLALVEMAHWYENMFLMGLVFLFFVNGEASGWIIGIIVCLAVYFLEIVIGNSFARMKWNIALNSAWIVALVLGGANIFLLLFIGL